MSQKQFVTRENIEISFHERRGEDGVYAEFDSQGRLTELSHSLGGVIHGFRLSVDYANRSATAVSEINFPDPRQPGVVFVEWVRDAVALIRKESTPRSAGSISCSFCGVGQDAVRKLVAGPGVQICNECIDMCAEVIAEAEEDKKEPADDH